MSNIWNHFEKIPEKTVAKCILCKKEYSYKTSVTNLKKHLSCKHLCAYQNFVNSNQPQKTVMTENENLQGSVVEETENGSSSVQNPQTVPSGASLQQQRKQQPITAYVPRKMDITRKKFIDKKLLKMITQDYQPFSIVEDTGFIEFVQALNPSYELPNRKLISGTLVPGQYLECKNQIIELVTRAKSICLTTDCWTSQAMDSYLAVTAHFLIDFELKSVLLHCEQLSGSHTADALAAVLKTIASQWNVTNKITLVVSDNAANVTSAIQKTGWPFFGCFLHKLNLIIEKAIRIIEFIIEKVKRIVGHFKKSNTATEALIKYQIDFEKKTVALRLVQSIPTRWNSTFYMLQRFLKLQSALQAVIPNLKVDLPIITVEMWVAIKQVCMILKPFEEITRIMSGTQYLTGSLAIIIVAGLKNVITVMKTRHVYGVAVNFLKKLEEGLDIYFPVFEIENNMLLGICTFLDPRFKTHGFLADAAAEEMDRRTTRAYLVKEHVLELLKTKLREKNKTTATNTVPSAPHTSTSTTVEDIETISIWDEIDKNIAAITPSVDDIAAQAKNELDMFLNENVVDRHSCPLSWWKSHAVIYPNLAEIFNESCHIVVTSVECERVFSKAGNFVTDKRSRLSRKRTAELVFLKHNKRYCK